MLPRVSVVIRSRGDAARSALLRRAVESAASQSGVDANVIVVLNGAQYDPEVLDWLKRSGVTLHVMAGPDKPGATAMGRKLVTGDFFSYLDDDDEYLPGALERRVRVLLADPLLDCVTTNGMYDIGGVPRIQYTDTAIFQENPRLALLQGKNWMTSCGGLFRTATVTQNYFDGLTRHCEWTLIAFRIASNLRVAFLDESTFTIHNTPASQSKTATYVETIPLVFTDMLAWNTDSTYRTLILRRRADALHDACSYYRLRGDFKRAWRYYFASVAGRGGWKYLPYAALLATRCRTPVRHLLRLRTS